MHKMKLVTFYRLAALWGMTLLGSCNLPGVTYHVESNSHTFHLEEGWKFNDTVKLVLNNQSEGGHRLNLGITTAESYLYSNLWIRYILRQKSNSILLDTTMNLVLAYPDGEPTGTGPFPYFNSQIRLPINKSVEEGEVEMLAIHLMRDSTLKGISKIGVSLNSLAVKTVLGGNRR